MNFAEQLFKCKTIEKIPPAFVLILAEATLSIAGKSLIFGRAAKYNLHASNAEKDVLAEGVAKLMIFVLTIVIIFLDKRENKRLVQIAEKYSRTNLPKLEDTIMRFVLLFAMPVILLVKSPLSGAGETKNIQQLLIANSKTRLENATTILVQFARNTGITFITLIT